MEMNNTMIRSLYSHLRGLAHGLVWSGFACTALAQPSVTFSDAARDIGSGLVYERTRSDRDQI